MPHRRKFKPKKASRPQKPIDWDLVDQLLMSGCPGTKIAAQFDVHPDTFYLRCQDEKGLGFTEYCLQKRSKGDALLHHHQYKKALGITDAGDTTLLIWLGKTRLDQRETTESAIAPETMKEFKSIMSQLTDYQEALKIADINNNDE